jgi:CRP-like cAMP-binding protein
MSASAIPTRSQGRPAKRIPSANSARPAKSTIDEISKPSRRQTPKSPPKNGNTVFDPETFLARAGLGRQVLNLKKNETAYAQGDTADAIFYVQKGQLRVTVTSANGKGATLALVGAGEFLGEDCMVLAHPLRLATATAMTECALLRISKTEMVRVLHQEHALSDVFVSFLLTRSHKPPSRGECGSPSLSAFW